MTDDRFDADLLKLLLQIAWADGRIHRVEGDIILGLAKAWAVPEAEVKALRASLTTGAKVSPPNFALLKTRPQRVLEAIRLLAQADGVVEQKEAALLAEAERLFGEKLR